MTPGNKLGAQNLEMLSCSAFAYGKTSSAASFFLLTTARLHNQWVQQVVAAEAYHFVEERCLGEAFLSPEAAEHRGLVTQSWSVHPCVFGSLLDGLFFVA